MCLSYLEGAGAGVAKSGKKVRGESSEPNPMARLKDWGWAVVEVANRRRLVFSVLALMVGELLPQKLEGLKCHSLARPVSAGLTFSCGPVEFTHLCPVRATSALYAQLCLR